MALWAWRGNVLHLKANLVLHSRAWVRAGRGATTRRQFCICLGIAFPLPTGWHSTGATRLWKWATEHCTVPSTTGAAQHHQWNDFNGNPFWLQSRFSSSPSLNGSVVMEEPIKLNYKEANKQIQNMVLSTGWPGFCNMGRGRKCEGTVEDWNRFKRLNNQM